MWHCRRMSCTDLGFFCSLQLPAPTFPGQPRQGLVCRSWLTSSMLGCKGRASKHSTDQMSCDDFVAADPEVKCHGRSNGTKPWQLHAWSLVDGTGKGSLASTEHFSQKQEEAKVSFLDGQTLPRRPHPRCNLPAAKMLQILSWQMEGLTRRFLASTDPIAAATFFR